MSTAPQKAKPISLPSDWLTQLQHWANTQPQQIALWHKQRGRWATYRWAALLQALEALRDGLRQQGVGEHSRLAVSGAWESSLIMWVLAAQTTGAQVFTVNRLAQGATLRALLDAIAPTHAFVQDRKILSAWLLSGHAPHQPVQLYLAQPVMERTTDAGVWHIVPLESVGGAIHAGTVQHEHHTRPPQQALLWTDEGTEWANGLEQLLLIWLHTGRALASPEVIAAATRDRHEVQPQRIIASPQREQELQAELQARLPLSGSWQRRWIELAHSRSDHPLAQWLLRRIARLHGLPTHEGESKAAPAVPHHTLTTEVAA